MGILIGTATVGFVGNYLAHSGEYPASQLINASFSFPFTDGTGLNQANLGVAAAIPLAMASTSTYDLTSGFDDAYGVLILLTKVKGLLIRNRSTTAGENLTLAGNFCSSSLGLTNHVIKPGSVVCFVDPTGFVVTASSADTITVQNANATTVTYDIILWGTV
jgi:hypothetical protein